MKAILRTLKSTWKTKKSFDIRDLGSNMVLILFDEEYDLDHILMHGPWSFNKYLLGLYKLERNESVKNTQFDRASFWVQIHDLPIQHTNKVNVEAIGNSVGFVEQVDASPMGDCQGRCLRIHINMDTCDWSNFCQGIKVDIGESSPRWVSFHYERMPIFCYWCRLLNHDERDCKLWVCSKGTLQKEDQQYGVWLKTKIGRAHV